MAVIVLPATVDDSGDGLSGTKLDKAYLESVVAAVDVVTHSTTNPTVTPEDIIDEVVLARGDKASLDARLDVEHNDDGTHKFGTSIATFKQVQDTIAAVNWLANDDFLVWPFGDTTPPAYWTIDGGSSARTGTGLADTTRKHGDFAYRMSGTGAVAPGVYQTVLDAAAFTRYQALRGRSVSFGVRIKTTNSNIRLQVDDGVSTTDSDPHSGGASGGPESDGWEWLTVTHIISASATLLRVRVFGPGVADVFYLSGATLVLGEIAPRDWVPSPRSVHTAIWHRAGNLATGTDLGNLTFPRPAIVLNVRLHAGTAPTGQAWIVDVNQWDGAAFTSMFGATKPQVAAGAKDGERDPDGTYRYRCFSGQEIASISSAQMSWDTDQVGSGATGAEGSIEVRYMQYDRPLEGSILEFAD